MLIGPTRAMEFNNKKATVFTFFLFTEPTFRYVYFGTEWNDIIARKLILCDAL